MGVLSWLFPQPKPFEPQPGYVDSAAHGGLADAVYAYAMQPQVEASNIAGYAQAARVEQVSRRWPVAYRTYAKRDKEYTVTKQIRAACMDQCCRRIREGKIGWSWEDDFVPAATADCKVAVKPIIVGMFPLLGLIAWQVLGNFVVWLIGKIIWSFLKEALERVFPGALQEAPGTVVAGFAMREGIR